MPLHLVVVVAGDEELDELLLVGLGPLERDAARVDDERLHRLDAHDGCVAVRGVREYTQLNAKRRCSDLEIERRVGRTGPGVAEANDEIRFGRKGERIGASVQRGRLVGLG